MGAVAGQHVSAFRPSVVSYSIVIYVFSRSYGSLLPYSFPTRFFFSNSRLPGPNLLRIPLPAQFLSLFLFLNPSRVTLFPTRQQNILILGDHPPNGIWLIVSTYMVVSELEK